MLTLVNIFNVFKYGLTGVFLFIDSLVYWFVCKLFFLFNSLAKVEFLTQTDYQDIAQRFYVIIGVVMLFYLTYSLLKALINPDDANKNMGKIVTNLVISLILIGIVPILFSYAFQIQNAVLKDNIIGNLVLGTGSDGEAIQDNSIDKQGGAMTVTILSAFLNPGGEDVTGEGKYNWKEFLSDILFGFYGTYKIEKELNVDFSGEGITWEEFIEEASSGNAEAFFNITAFAEPISYGNADYKPIISTICGVFLAYVLVSFCIDLGIRVVKLAFYQIIAPIPILMRIIPEKKSVFDNWIKGTIATFMEVFIRLFIMFIIVFLAILVLNPKHWSDTGVGFIGNVLIVMGLFAFANQAPKLISDVIGISSGNIKLGIGGKLEAGGPIGKTINHVGKASIGALTGGLGGMTTGLQNANINTWASVKQGFAKGMNKGGNQFKKQRQDTFESYYGYDKKQGLFGGMSFQQRMKDNYGKAVEKMAKEEAREFMNRYEQSRIFMNAFHSELNNGNRYADIVDSLEHSVNGFAEIFDKAEEAAERFARQNGIKRSDQRAEEARLDYLKKIAAATQNKNEKVAIETALQAEKMRDLYQDYDSISLSNGANVTSYFRFNDATIRSSGLSDRDVDTVLEAKRNWLAQSADFTRNLASGTYSREEDGKHDKIYNKKYEEASGIESIKRSESSDDILRDLRKYMAKK